MNLAVNYYITHTYQESIHACYVFYPKGIDTSKRMLYSVHKAEHKDYLSNTSS